MAEVIKLEIDLETGNIKGLSKDIENKLGKSGGRAGKLFGKNFNDTFKDTTKTIFKGAFFANLATEAFIKSLNVLRDALGGVFEAGITLERLETQFQTLLGSSKAASDQIKELQDFAATTPFQLEGLASATQKLLAFGIEQTEIIDKLKQLGDAAASSGSDLGELARIYGQIRAATRLTGERLLQLEERAIPIGPALAKSLGVAESSVRDLVREGKVSFEIFEEAFRSLSEESGVFANGTVRLSQTVGGLLSTLSDNFFNLSSRIAKEFAPVIKFVIADTISLVQSLVASFEGIRGKVIPNLVDLGQGFIDFVVAPLEAVIRTLDIAQKGLFTLGSVVGRIFGAIAGQLGTFLELIGADGSISQSLQEFNKNTELIASGAISRVKESVNSLANLDTATALNEKLEEFRQFSRELNEEAKQNTRDLAESLTDSASQTTSANELIVLAYAASLEKIKKQNEKIVATINKTVNNGIARAISGGIQNIINSLSKGENAFQSFGSFLLGVFGDLAIQLGTFLITTGLGIESLKSLATAGAATVAQGVALVALGGILKSLSGGSGGSVGTGGAGSSPTEVGLADSGVDSSTGSETEERTTQSSVTINVEGSLVQQQELGLFISDILNETREDRGTVETSVRFA